MYKESRLAESHPREEADPEPSDLVISPGTAKQTGFLELPAHGFVHRHQKR